MKISAIKYRHFVQVSMYLFPDISLYLPAEQYLFPDISLYLPAEQKTNRGRAKIGNPFETPLNLKSCSISSVHRSSYRFKILHRAQK